MTDRCLGTREALFTNGGLAGAAIADHLAACAACRAWAHAFTAGARDADDDEAFTSEILLHGALARLNLDPTGDVFADIDPGPAFTARVLAATTRADVRGPLAWRMLWLSLVRRPRFAFEAAYLLTLVFVLVAGNPLAAVGRTMDRAEPLVERIEPSARAIGARVVEMRGVGSSVRDVGSGFSRTIPSLAALARRVAAPLSGWLTRLAAVARSAAAWLERQLAEPDGDLTRSS
jgi:hypothetical protein